MNSIDVDQNSPTQLQRLAAQRQLYATGKIILGWQVFLGGPVAVATAFLAASLMGLKPYVALWGLLLSLADIVWLTPWQKRLRAMGAQVQELFDCEVLGLPWSDVKAGRRPDPELIKEQADKYEKKSESMPPLTNWYSPDVRSLPLYLARIACQRSNCWWDAKQRRRYAVVVVSIVAVVFVSVLFASMVNGLTVESFILAVVAPLLPLLILGYRQFSEQMEVVARLEKLKDHGEKLWSDAMNGASEQEVTRRARDLQDEILENRRRSPLVFDALFRLLRNDYDAQMNHGAQQYVADAQRRLQG